MAKWKVYTPDGVQDILFEECYLKKEIENKARNLFRSRGYREIETPTIEFYDVFSARQNVLSQETMFKFCDKEGRLLALRPDLTVPAVRVATSKLKDAEKPLLLFYIGNSFRFNGSGGGKQKEYTQAGIELIGAEGSNADAEVIAAAVALLKESGLKDFKIDIGQVEFFKGLVEEIKLTEEETEALREAIDNKDYLGLEKMIQDREIPKDVKALLRNLPGLFGSKEIIEEIGQMQINTRSRKALSNLKEVLEILEDYGYGDVVSVDLGMLPGLDYYTGIIFRGFTYGIGFPVCSGGRYDGLAETFGEPSPATGFSLGVNLLIAAMHRQKLTRPQLDVEYFIVYEREQRKLAFQEAERLKGEGWRVQMDVKGFSLEEALDYAVKNRVSQVLYLSDGDKVNVFDLKAWKGGGV